MCEGSFHNPNYGREPAKSGVRVRINPLQIKRAIQEIFVVQHSPKDIIV